MAEKEESKNIQSAQKERQGKKSFKKSKIRFYTKEQVKEEISRLERANGQRCIYFKHLKEKLAEFKS